MICTVALVSYRCCIIQCVLYNALQYKRTNVQNTQTEEWRKTKKKKKTFRKTSEKLQSERLTDVCYFATLHTKYISDSEKSDNCNQRSKSIDELTSSFWLLFILNVNSFELSFFFQIQTAKSSMNSIHK